MASSKLGDRHGHRPRLSSDFLCLYLRVLFPAPAIVFTLGVIREKVILEFSEAIGLNKDALPFLDIVLLAIVQAIGLAAVGHMTRSLSWTTIARTVPSQDHQPDQETMARETPAVEPPKATPKDTAEQWGDLNPFKPPSLKEKGKKPEPKTSTSKGKDKEVSVDPVVSIHEQSDQPWLLPPQPEDEEHFLADYRVPSVLFSYPPELHYISDIIVRIVQLSINIIEERVRAEKEAAVGHTQPLALDNAIDEAAEEQKQEGPAKADQQMTEENGTPTENMITESTTPSPSGSSPPTAIPPSDAAVDTSPPNEVLGGQQRPTAGKPSRSWLRRVFPHRQSSPAVPPTEGMDRNQTTPTPPSAFTRFIYKTILRSSDGAKKEIECIACFESVKKGDLVKAAVCGHIYCKPCFEQLILTALQSEAQFPPKCCLNPFPFRTIIKYSSKSTKELYTKKSTEYSVPLNQRIYCPALNCGDWHHQAKISADTTPECSKGHKMCISCHQIAHEKGKCCPQDHDRVQAEALFREEGWQQCYSCHTFVEHIGGCTHMTCQCGAHFCYVCGGKWGNCQCSYGQIAAIKAKAHTRRWYRTMREKQEASQASQTEKTTSLKQQQPPPFIPNTPRQPPRRRPLPVYDENWQPHPHPRPYNTSRLRGYRQVYTPPSPSPTPLLARLTSISEQYSRLTSILTTITSHQSSLLSTAHSTALTTLQKAHSIRRHNVSQSHTSALTSLRSAQAAALKTFQDQFDNESSSLERGYAEQVSHTYQHPKPDTLLEDLDKLYLSHERKRATRRERHEAVVKKVEARQQENMRLREGSLKAERERLEKELQKQERELNWRHEMEWEWLRLVREERERLLK
ncbi:hypothetical protein B0T21DRAFT_204470 [Apiosordaria backusii]|uniref:RING-type domain-containing protein n=1 Tax=Apiosordaria backusii TaxID=314023 RepID=A0AA40E5I9_9PEZI|nr:hypothetical protein B0T21DRAFT_204470 [Apiosordaria backusii]